MDVENPMVIDAYWPEYTRLYVPDGEFIFWPDVGEWEDMEGEFE